MKTKSGIFMTVHKPRFKFSFIMPLYNVEPYLREAVDSILKQDIGFKENVEIIFVNDGSPDNSEKICLEYQKKYPDNIKYFKQENKGLSAARNAGFALVEGRYVSFMDADDRLSSDTLSSVYAFFEKHRKQVDFVSIKQTFFENRVGPHPLSYKYDRSHIVDIEKEYESVQLSACSSFVKAEVLQKYKFDASIRKFSEDVKFLAEVVLDKMAYGVVSGPTYFYRRRDTGASIIDSSKTSPLWYTSTPIVVYRYIFEYAQKRLGHIPRYFQYMIMYDIKGRLRQESQDVLTESEEKRYKESLRWLIKRMDDDIILGQKGFDREYAYLALKMKYGQSVVETAKREGLRFIYKGVVVYDYAKTNPFVQLTALKVKGRKLTLEGNFTGFLFKDVVLTFRLGEKWYDTAAYPSKKMARFFLGELVHDRNHFRVVLSIEEFQGITPYVRVGGQTLRMRLVMRPEEQAALPTTGGYKKYGAYLVAFAHNQLIVMPDTLLRRVKETTKQIVRKAR